MKIKTFLLLLSLTTTIVSSAMNNTPKYKLATLPEMEWHYAKELLHYARNNNYYQFGQSIKTKETRIGKNIRHAVLASYNTSAVNDEVSTNLPIYKKIFTDLNKQLLESARKENVFFTKLLLIHGANVNVTEDDEYKYTPLAKAIIAENIATVKLLLSHPHINPNILVQEYPMPLLALRQSKGAEMVQLLLQSEKLNINDSDYRGWTILHAAAASGNVDLVKQLLKLPNINPNALTTDEYSPIYLAWWNNHTEVVGLLHSRTDFSLTPEYTGLRVMGMLTMAMGCIAFVLNR